MEVHKRRSDQNSKVLVTHDSRLYDVTDFVSKHPGGREVLLKYNGRDVTEVMLGPKPHRHSEAAYSILKALSGEEVTKGRNGCSSKGSLGASTDQIDVDWSEPLADQVSRLRGGYFAWVHQPVEQDIRFFKSDILEALTSCSWYVIPILWLPIMAYLLVSSIRELQSAGGEVWLPWLWGGVIITEWRVSLLFVSGVFLWTLLEYVFHRWFFHFCPPADFPSLITLHFLIHGQHHKSPMDKRRLVFPPVPASLFACFLWNMYRLVFSPAMCSAIFAGSIFGYVAYDLIHYYLHHGTPWLPYFKTLKQYHMKHHFGCPDSGFGISSKLWDIIFGTEVPLD